MPDSSFGAFLKLVTAAITAFWIGVNPTLQLLFIFVILDYGTGVGAAIVEGKVSSEIGFKGITKKVILLILTFSIQLIEPYIDSQIIDLPVSLTAAVAGFYIANEGILILENVQRAGLPVPEFLTRIFSRIK